jgi:tyrosyl-tRNA synthetase
VNVDREMGILLTGTEEVVEPDSLARKLIRSAQTGQPLTVKLGLDPNAPDIHLGHTVVLEKLRQFQELGHQVVLLIGDFTGRVGDPTDKTATRKQLTTEQVDAFASTYVEQAVKVLDSERLSVRHNSEWLAPLSLAQLVELMAQVTLARILEREDFRRRMAEHLPLHLHELLYPLMQGYDSVALRADVELGGTDQRFNIMTARQLQEAYGQEPEVAMFMPILEGTDGVKKMSKSLGNYVGIAEPPGEMFGKIMSIPDGLISRWGTLLLGWPADRTALAQGPALRELKAELAHDLTQRFWGPEPAAEARSAFDRTFRSGEVPRDATPLPLPAGGPEVAALDLVAGLPGVPSRGEARRLLGQGAVTVDGRRVALEDRVVIGAGSWIRLGRHRFFRFEGDE